MTSGGSPNTESELVQKHRLFTCKNEVGYCDGFVRKVELLWAYCGVDSDTSRTAQSTETAL